MGELYMSYHQSFEKKVVELHQQNRAVEDSLVVDRLHFGWSGRHVLHNICFHLQRGESIVISGASGGGKSTLLKLLAGILTPQQGKVLFQTACGNKRKVHGFTTWMGQNDLLLPWRNILSNTLLHLELGRADLSAGQQHAMMLLEQLGLLGLLNSKPHLLSQGMRQRVALARTLCSERPFILLDEPCSALDPENRSRALELIASEQKRRGFGLVMVTHNSEDAAAVSGVLRYLVNGELRAQ